MQFKQLFRRKSIEMILAHSQREQDTSHSMRRDLGVRDLTSFGIAAIIGASIFSTISNAATASGPAVHCSSFFSHCLWLFRRCVMHSSPLPSR
ncbi:MAG: hypothetical protein IPH20_12865 [Bacteroidales bacterium]|nr:hypothetical protein [Bacteroidales bacterium]